MQNVGAPVRGARTPRHRKRLGTNRNPTPPTKNLPRIIEVEGGRPERPPLHPLAQNHPRNPHANPRTQIPRTQNPRTQIRPAKPGHAKCRGARSGRPHFATSKTIGNQSYPRADKKPSANNWTPRAGGPNGRPYIPSHKTTPKNTPQTRARKSRARKTIPQSAPQNPRPQNVGAPVRGALTPRHRKRLGTNRNPAPTKKPPRIIGGRGRAARTAAPTSPRTNPSHKSLPQNPRMQIRRPQIPRPHSATSKTIGTIVKKPQKTPNSSLCSPPANKKSRPGRDFCGGVNLRNCRNGWIRGLRRGNRASC